MSRVEAHGVCPHCQAYTGPVGTPCIRAACAKGPYHCIPVDWYDATRAYSARKNRPIDPRVGRMVDKYLLCANLGEGGMGSVYVAIQKPLFREVAIKLIADLELTRISVGRFEREARAISLLEHPNIVKIHDYGVAQFDRKIPYMVLEYLRHGRTLRKAIGSLRNGGTVDAAVVLKIFQQVLQALGAAHAAGIIHRDVKPENIMVVAVHGDPYFVKVLDFGLARLESDDTSFEGEDAAAGRLVGTPYYMAPEQIPTRKNASMVLDGRADLYAVAVMLYEVLTGTRPFEASDPLSVLAQKMDPAVDPMTLPAAQGLSKSQRSLLARGLARDPDQRFASAQEMSEALQDALSPSSRIVGLVVLGAEDSSDRVIPPSSDPGTDLATPGGPQSALSPEPGARPPSGFHSSSGRPSQETPRPSSETPLPESPAPLKPREPLPFPSSPLEVDIPEVSTAPRPRPSAPPPEGPGITPRTPVPPATASLRPAPRPSLPESFGASAHPPRRATPPRYGLWVLGLGLLGALLVLIPTGLSWWRMNEARRQMNLLSQVLTRQGRFVGTSSPRIRPQSGEYIVVSDSSASGDPPTPVLDPWGTSYRVHFDVRRGIYSLRSLGPDRDSGVCQGQEDGGDDLCLDLGPP